MIHILLIILKIIGWILLILLGLIILLIMTVLFTPVRYEISADSSGKLETTSGSARVSVFFHLVKLFVQYNQDGFVWKGRIAWKKIGDNTEDEVQPELEMAEEDWEHSNLEEEEPKEEEPKEEEPKEEEPKEEEPKEEEPKEEEPKEEETKEEKTKEQEPKIQKNETKEPVRQKKEKKEKKPRKERIQSKGEAIKRKLLSLGEKIKSFYRSMAGKKANIEAKKKLVMAFVENEDHQTAIKKILKELKRFLKKAVPRKLTGNVEYGLEGPSLTGKLLGLISMLYPVFPGDIEVNANFQEKILRGDVYIKGKFRLSYVVSFAGRLLLNKSVRITVRHILKIAKKIKGGK